MVPTYASMYIGETGLVKRQASEAATWEEDCYKAVSGG